MAFAVSLVWAGCQSEPALDRIVAIGEPTVPVLAKAFGTDPPGVRAGIVEALKKIGGSDADGRQTNSRPQPVESSKFQGLGQK